MSDYLMEFPEDDVIEVLFDDVIVTGAEPPSGTISITENGSYDVSNYAEASVNVPEPSGSISITQNGTVDVKNYASANVNVPQGVFPTGTLPITQNGSYDVTNYAGASVNVPQPSGSISITQNGTVDVAAYASAIVNVSGGLPSYMTIDDVKLTSSSDSLTFDYDPLKSLYMALCYNTNMADSNAYVTNLVGNIYNGGSRFTIYNNAQGVHTWSTSYGSVSLDPDTSKITFNSRGSNYNFKSNRTYRCLLIYAEA